MGVDGDQDTWFSTIFNILLPKCVCLRGREPSGGGGACSGTPAGKRWVTPLQMAPQNCGPHGPGTPRSTTVRVVLFDVHFHYIDNADWVCRLLAEYISFVHYYNCIQNYAFFLNYKIIWTSCFDRDDSRPILLKSSWSTVSQRSNANRESLTIDLFSSMTPLFTQLYKYPYKWIPDYRHASEVSSWCRNYQV